MRDFDNINLLEFQQPLNCCNITALAYACTALGHPTTVDNIFYSARLPLHWVIDAGMTLQATADAGIRYMEREQLPFAVTAFHLDAGRMDLSEFREMMSRSVLDPDDIHIMNFQVGIAHQIPSLAGGHFSLLADYDSKSDSVTIADTHPKKYGRLWHTKGEHLYQACCDLDSSVGRARGFIEVRRLGEHAG